MEENLMINRYKRPRSISGRLADESGIVLIAALLVMIFLTFLGTTVVILSSSNVKVSRNNESSSQAFMVAEAGVAEAIDKLRTDTNWGPNTDESGTVVNPDWAPNSNGVVDLSAQNGQYNITLYDRSGSYGREANAARPDNYATLASNEVLVEVSGTVDGFERKVSVIVRSAIEAFEYALFSEGSIDATGTGPNPGTINGKQYAKGGINWQGNYDLSQSEAVTPASVSPNCSSGKWSQCDSNATAIDAPLLDFAYYQDQTNFDGGDNPQQVFIMTPTVGGPGNVADCAGPCDRTWMLRYAMETLGNTYTLTARVEAIKNSKNDWDNVVYYCPTPDTTTPWNGTAATCPGGGGAPSSYLFNSSKAENTKPFVNALQFNAYVAPTDPPYTTAPNPGSIVNVFDATGHLEFLGPPAGQTATVTATILVGTASDNSTPIGKIDIEGGAGALIFDPANGLAIVAETIKFVAKYSPINVTVGSTGSGALLIAKKELDIEGEHGNNVTMTLNGSAVVGGDNLTGAADNNNRASIKIEHTAQFDVNYVPPASYPAGWSDYGSLKFERREWREL